MQHLKECESTICHKVRLLHLIYIAVTYVVEVEMCKVLKSEKDEMLKSAVCREGEIRWVRSSKKSDEKER